MKPAPKKANKRQMARAPVKSTTAKLPLTQTSVSKTAAPQQAMSEGNPIAAPTPGQATAMPVQTKLKQEAPLNKEHI
jgi:hypothetical protein